MFNRSTVPLMKISLDSWIFPCIVFVPSHALKFIVSRDIRVKVARDYRGDSGLEAGEVTTFLLV